MGLDKSEHTLFSHNSAISNHDLTDQLSKSSHGWNEVSQPPGSARKKFESHDFPGYGSYDVRTKPTKYDMDQINESLHQKETNEVFLNELEATAISGNDILSSTFYASGLCAVSAGKMTPVCLALVGICLYIFRGIYHETVMALPVNGGTYNILLNSTSKQMASIAAVFGIIAYITTGVVSGLDAVAYLQTVLPEGAISQKYATIALLGFFCLITNLGIKESASVAKVIFIFHVATLSLLTILGCAFMYYNHALLIDNYMNTDYPPAPSHHQLNLNQDIVIQGTWLTAIFYGFSSAMLGVSGFETSAQFVEEQAPGVFPKTLRNMWAGVMLFNPLLSLISFSALPVSEIIINRSTVLSQTAKVIGNWIQEEFSLPFPAQYQLGPLFSAFVSIDAFVVLAAALLTSFIGINGLIRRMSLDRCLPQSLLWQNPYTGTDSIILIGFFFLCVSQVILLDGNVEALGGVYCYSFLGVMIIFALGNILLKVKRPSLPREITTSWLQSIVGLVSVIIALLGNILGKPELLVYFFMYFFIVGTLVFIMFQRVPVMRLLYRLLKPKRNRKTYKFENDLDDHTMLSIHEENPLISVETGSSASKSSGGVEKEIGYETIDSPRTSDPLQEETCLSRLSKQLKSFQDVPFVFFCKHDDLHLLNKAILYILNNEQTNRIIIVHCDTNYTDTDMLAEHVKLMDLLYPKTKISLLIIDSPFSPATIEWLSIGINVPTNAMFISCPDENFAMKFNQLRGMRIITSYN